VTRAGGAGSVLTTQFFAGDARDVARSLIGKLLVRDDGRSARLVEVEAYLGGDDPASHAYRGRTPRTEIMFGPGGRLYVYFSYGVHWCANVVCGPEGVASAVLLRAAQPVGGVAAMTQARWRGQRQLRERDLCRGPGRLCEAFGITGADNGLDLTAAAGVLRLADDGLGAGGEIVATPRIGLSRAADLPWRYLVAGSPFVSAASAPAARPEPPVGPAPVGPAPVGPPASRPATRPVRRPGTGR
jgi:DNA-3-methyladenine glycosylase